MAIHGPTGTPVLDTGIHADGALSASWTGQTSNCGNATHRYVGGYIYMDEVYVENGWNDTVFSADQEAFFQVVTLVDTQGVGLILRADNLNTNSALGYEIFIRRTGATYTCNVYNYFNGCGYVEKDPHTVTFGDNYFFGVSAKGADIEIYTSADGDTWNLQFTEVVSEHLGAGKLGLYSENGSVTNPVKGRQFGGGDRITVVPPTPPTPYVGHSNTVMDKIIKGLL